MRSRCWEYNLDNSEEKTSGRRVTEIIFGSCDVLIDKLKVTILIYKLVNS